MKGKLLMCLLALFASFLPSIRWKGKEKTVFLGGQNWREWQFEEVPDTTPQISTFFRETDTVLLSSLAWFKVTLVEVGNLRNKKKKGKGRGSLTTFFFERLMSMIESFKLMSSASERASLGVSWKTEHPVEGSKIKLGLHLSFAHNNVIEDMRATLVEKDTVVTAKEC